MKVIPKILPQSPKTKYISSIADSRLVLIATLADLREHANERDLRDNSNLRNCVQYLQYAIDTLENYENDKLREKNAHF